MLGRFGLALVCLVGCVDCRHPPRVTCKEAVQNVRSLMTAAAARGEPGFDRDRDPAATLSKMLEECNQSPPSQAALDWAAKAQSMHALQRCYHL